jgi:hypothetical protein
MITTIVIKEKNRIYQRKYQKTEKGKETIRRYQKTEKGKEAMRRYQQSEKGKEAMRRYQQSEKGKETIRIYQHSERFKEINKRYKNKKREKILKAREEEDIIPTEVGGAGEILSSGKYKRRNWTKKEENILRECKRRCKSPYKVSMPWKAIGILLNRPRKSIRNKWRRMIEDEEEIILLQPNIGIKKCGGKHKCLKIY